MADLRRSLPSKRYDSTSLPFPSAISWTPPFLLESKQLRIVILREHKSRGKQVVFDSTVWERQQQRKTNGVSRQSGVKEKINHVENPRRSSVGGKSKAGDAELLAEMMFGSVPFVSKSRGATVKVHELKNQSRLLFTKIFTIQPILNGTNSMSEHSFSSTSSSHSLPILAAKSDPIHPDWSLPTSPLDILRPGSSFTSSASAGSFQASSPGSLHLRRVKSFITSFEYNQSVQEGMTSPDVQKCSKLAIGVIVVLPVGESDEIKQKQRHFEDFFFSHFPLLESHIERLKTQVENLLQNGSKNAQEIIAEYISSFKLTLLNLANNARLSSPFWSCLVASSSLISRPVASRQFIGLLHNALQFFNKQSQNFFMTRLLSATLQYHLGWVSTVSPAEENPTKAFLNKHFSHSLSSLAQSHPYNPFWAQLADLYGSVGSPCHFARTVLVGRKAAIIYQLLYVLSYFIRCSDVSETNYELKSLLLNQTPKAENIEKDSKLSSSIPLHTEKGPLDSDKADSVDSGFCNSEDPGCEGTKKKIRGLHSSLLEHDMAQDQHLEDKFGELESVPLLCLQPIPKEIPNDENEIDIKCLSMSLFGGFVPEYLPDFVLHGTAEPLDDFILRLHNDLKAQIQHPCVEEMIDEAVCIVADTDRWTCDVVSLANKRRDIRRSYSEPLLQIRRATCSAFIHKMLQMQLDFQARNMPEEFCLTQLEDGLQEIYYKSKILSEHHHMSGGTSESNPEAMAGVEKTDLPLLFSVASTHCPYIPPQLDIF